jgi:hypothetical protein
VKIAACAVELEILARRNGYVLRLVQTHASGLTYVLEPKPAPKAAEDRSDHWNEWKRA